MLSHIDVTPADINGNGVMSSFLTKDIALNASTAVKFRIGKWGNGPGTVRYGDSGRGTCREVMLTLLQ